MKWSVVLLLVLCGVLCHAQPRSATLPLIDVSNPAQQFIAFKGSITFSEQLTNEKMLQTQKATASGTVVSEKPIVAFVALFEWVGFGADPRVLSARHDHFFGPHDLPKGLTIDFDVPQGDVVTNDSDGTVTTSKYTVQLKFAQFADGSIWGDKSIGDEITAQRADITAYLQHTLSAYRLGDEQSFAAAVNAAPVSKEHQQRTSAFAVRKHIQMVQSESGTAAAIALVRDQLKNADTRRASGHFQ